MCMAQFAHIIKEGPYYYEIIHYIPLGQYKCFIDCNKNEYISWMDDVLLQHKNALRPRLGLAVVLQLVSGKVVVCKWNGRCLALRGNIFILFYKVLVSKGFFLPAWGPKGTRPCERPRKRLPPPSWSLIPVQVFFQFSNHIFLIGRNDMIWKGPTLRRVVK